MDISSVLTRNLAHHIQKLNLYVLPKYIWLVLLYYLSLNAVLNLFFYLGNKNPSFINVLPGEAIKINTLILNGIEKWVPFIWFLCIAFFISGLSIAFLKFITSKIYDVEYGLHIGFWLLVIGTTFELYNFSGVFFLLLIPFTALVKYGMEKLMYKLQISYV